ncbi:MAG: hypothetical protein K2N87_07515 [Eubacterium sp.]|nr:hypothetical protein [Eubacterium sp.]
MIREFQKIYSRRASIGLLLAAVFCSVLLSAFFIHDYTYEVAGDDGAVYIQGREGVWMERKAMEEISAELSVENLNASLQYYHSLADTTGSGAGGKMETEADRAQHAYDRKYPGWRILLEYAYVPEHESGEALLQKLYSADDFYKNIPKQLYEKMRGYDGFQYSKAEKGRASRMLAKVQQPYRFEFLGQWAILLKVSYLFFYVLLLYAVVLSGQVFSCENECGMDLILLPCGKKTMYRMAYRKMGGVFLYLTMVLFACVAVQMLLIFACCGISGADSSVQMMWQFFFCLYPMKVWQFFLYSYIVAWAGILCVTAVGAFLNACTKNKFFSMILTVLFLAVSSAADSLPGTRGSAVLQRLVLLQPVTAFNPLSYGRSLRTFAIGRVVLRSGDAVLLVCIVLFAAAVLLAPRVYWKRAR